MNLTGHFLVVRHKCWLSSDPSYLRSELSLTCSTFSGKWLDACVLYSEEWVSNNNNYYHIISHKLTSYPIILYVTLIVIAAVY